MGKYIHNLYLYFRFSFGLGDTILGIMSTAIKNRLLLVMIAVILSTTIFLSCTETKPKADGNYHNVICLVPDEKGEVYEPFVRNYVQEYVITPQRETVYDFYFMDSTVFHKYVDNRFILVVSHLDAYGLSGQLVRNILSDEAKEEIKNRSYGIYVLEDVWAEGQTVGFIIGADREMLAAAIELHGSEIAETFTDIMNRNLYKIMKNSQNRSGELDIEKKIEEKYGFHIMVPKDFAWEAGKPEDDFLWLRHLTPEQWIFIYREDIPNLPDSVVDTPGKKLASIDFIQKRDSLCAEYYEGDIVDSIVEAEYGIFIDSLPGFRLEGIWRNDSSLLGGPFVSYVLDDSSSMTRYFFDAAVFMPGKKKEYFLRMTHSTMYTFESFE